MKARAYARLDENCLQLPADGADEEQVFPALDSNGVQTFVQLQSRGATQSVGQRLVIRMHRKLATGVLSHLERPNSETGIRKADKPDQRGAVLPCASEIVPLEIRRETQIIWPKRAFTEDLPPFNSLSRRGVLVLSGFWARLTALWAASPP